MNIGYARVSTLDQNLDAQLEALKQAGCEKIYAEKVSGKSTDRPELDKLKNQLRKGDVLIITKLDRLARSTSDLVTIMSKLKDEGVGFKSLGENMDLTTPQGRFAMNIFASVAEFERELIVQRTKEGLALARVRGRVGGRRPALSELQEQEVIKTLDRGELSIKDVAKVYKVSPSTVKRVMKRHRENPIGAKS